MEDETNRVIERAADQLDAFSIRIAESLSHLTTECDVLKQEVTLLRSVNSDIKKTIRGSIKDNLPEIQEIMDQSIQNSVRREVAEISNPISSLTRELEAFSKTIEFQLKQYHRKFKFTGMAICMAFCLGSIATGFGLWWLFPQHQTIEFSMDQRRAMEYGTLLQFALPKLSEKDRQTVMDTMGESWEEYYKDLFLEGGR